MSEATIEPGLEPRAPRLGWRIAERPPPGFAHILGAAAGGFAVVAIVAFVVEVAGSDPTAPGVVFSAGLALVALGVGVLANGPIRSACVTAIVLCVPLLWSFAVFGSGSAGRGDVRLVLILTTASYVALYLLTWTKGRAVLLAGTLVVLASWISFEVAGSESSTFVPFADRVETSQTELPFGGTVVTDVSGTSTSAAAATLAVGLVFLAIGAVLDGRKLAGAATPFVAVGAVETIAGAIGLSAGESVLLGGLLAIGAGAVVGLVGGHGRDRRATTWIGGLTVFGGLVAILVDIAPTSAAGVGGIAVAFALALGAIAWVLAPRLGESDDGDGRTVAPARPLPPGDAAPQPVDRAGGETDAETEGESAPV